MCTEDVFPNKRLQQLISQQQHLRRDVPEEVVRKIRFGNQIFIEHAADVVSVPPVSPAQLCGAVGKVGRQVGRTHDTLSFGSVVPSGVCPVHIDSTSPYLKEWGRGGPSVPLKRLHLGRAPPAHLATLR